MQKLIIVDILILFVLRSLSLVGLARNPGPLPVDSMQCQTIIEWDQLIQFYNIHTLQIKGLESYIAVTVN